MDSTAPSPSASSSATPPADPSALRSCLQCHRRMSSLKYDLHTICTQCRSVACSPDIRCPACQSWSAELMSEYLKHKTSLAGKRRKKPATSASSTLAVASSPVLGSPPRLPSVSDDSVIRETFFLSCSTSLSQSGSLGSDLPFFSAPSPVPDSAPLERGATGETAALSPIS